ncbi:MAG: hypothetical protein RMA76_12405 [Deltaproteobacteria bacterium]|jgi:tetratricopeptide (TPR) repeat protein
MSRRPLVVVLAAALLVGGCAQLKARSAYSRGEKARVAGDLEGAIAGYREAYAADPKPEYQQALETAQKEGAATRAGVAREAEARGDYAEAVRQWDAALAFDPNDEELKARRELAGLRAKQSDPVEYYRAAERLAKVLPNDPAAQQALAESKKEALFYHLRLASVYAAAKSWSRAYAEYEIARTIQPDHAAFSGTTYRRTAAQHHEAEGDRLMAQGDAVAAYAAYDRATTLVSSSRVDKKMRRAQKGAGNVLDQLREAETFSRLGKWEEAAEAYSMVAGRADASDDVKKKATEARAKSANLRAERAKAYAERGLPAKAIRELGNAVDHTDGPIDAVQAARQGVDELLADRVDLAHQRFETAKAKSGSALAAVRASSVVMAAVANTSYERAKATTDPAEALVALRRLEPFAASLSGYEDAKKRLRKRAFGALLEKAKERSGFGNDDRAAELIATALEISKPPAKLAKPLEEGSAALTRGDFATALQHLAEAERIEPRSRLARVGHEVAKRARLRQLRRDADEARVVEDAVRATIAYRAILDIEPNDVSAQLGLSELKGQIVEDALSNARAHETAGRPGAAFVYYQRVVSMEPEHAEAKPAVAKLAKQLSGTSAAGLYVAPVIRGTHLGSTCPGIEEKLRDRLGLYLDRTDGLGAQVLKAVAQAEVDEKKRAAPPVVLRTAVEACDVSGTKGTARVTLQLVLGGRVLGQGSKSGAFDPSGVPKDELADGLEPSRVMSDVVGDAAKQVVQFVKSKSSELAGWRAIEARASLKAGDAERVARSYAGLVMKNGSKTTDERDALREIETFLNSRYR